MRSAYTEYYTLSLHDALPILGDVEPDRSDGLGITRPGVPRRGPDAHPRLLGRDRSDRKSTRLNSSHANISYAVFCLKNKIISNIATNHRIINLDTPEGQQHIR